MTTPRRYGRAFLLVLTLNVAFSACGAKEESGQSQYLPTRHVALPQTGPLIGRTLKTGGIDDGPLHPIAAQVDFCRDGQLVHSTHTDENGEFSIPPLAPGRYLAQVISPTHSGHTYVCLWEPHLAPPAAQRNLNLTAAPFVARGQSLSIQMPSFGQAMMYSGIVAGAAAGPFVHNAVKSDVILPQSP